MKVSIYNTKGETLEYFESENRNINVTYEPEESFGKIGYICIEGGEKPYQIYNIKITEE